MIPVAIHVPDICSLCLYLEPRYGEVEDVEAILASGVDANHQDAHGNTALHLSCANGHADVIRALIKAGASHLPNGAGNRWVASLRRSTAIDRV